MALRIHYPPNYQCWSNKYIRNNKHSGQKNLRCFPSCSNGIHNPKVYCGSQVEVEYNGDGKVLVYARFEPCSLSEENEICKSEYFDISVGHEIPHDTILKKLKTISEPLNPWLPGKLKSQSNSAIEEQIYEINAGKKGWHYGWNNRYKKEIVRHHLAIYAFKEIEDMESKIRCIDIAHSPSFLLVSARNRYHLSSQTESIKKRRSVMEVKVENTHENTEVIMQQQLLSTEPFTARQEMFDRCRNLEILYRFAMNMPSCPVDHESDQIQSHEESNERIAITKIAEDLTLYLLEPDFLKKIRDFCADNYKTAFKGHLLDRSFCSFIGLAESQIDRYLATKNHSLESLAEKIHKLGLASEEMNDQEPSGFQTYVSLMQQGLIASMNLLQENMYTGDDFPKHPLTGSWIRCDSTDERDTYSVMGSNWLISQLFRRLDQRIRTIFDGLVFKVQSHFSILPQGWASYTCDNKPHFNAILFTGSFTGNAGCGNGPCGDYIAWLENDHPMVQVFFWPIVKKQGGTPRRQRITRSFQLITKDSLKLCIVVEEDMKETSIDIPAEELHCWTVEQRISFPALWEVTANISITFMRDIEAKDKEVNNLDLQSKIIV